jgi:hypothetical protein
VVVAGVGQSVGCFFVASAGVTWLGDWQGGVVFSWWIVLHWFISTNFRTWLPFIVIPLSETARRLLTLLLLQPPLTPLMVIYPLQFDHTGLV